MKPLVAWCGWFVILNSCATGGPKITYCIIDSMEQGFRCVPYQGDSYFKPLPEGDRYVCMSPGDTESFLKACKRRLRARVDICIVDAPEVKLECISGSSGQNYTLTLVEADNYACTSPKDYRRVLERCKTVESVLVDGGKRLVGF